MPTPFAQRFLQLAEQRSPLCLGIDPSAQLLNHWQLPDTVDGLKQFCDIIQPICAHVALIKPQFAFFERFGPEGMRCLQSLIQEVKKSRTLVLADCKRGDISHTMTAYAEAIVGEHSAFQADAMTVTAYLGLEAMTDAIAHIDNHHGVMFVVVRSSNIEGQILQSAQIEDKSTIAEMLAQQITTYNHMQSPTHEQLGSLGAVIGATLTPSDAERFCEQLPNALLLTPGLGAQGADYHHFSDSFAKAKGRLIPTESRSILRTGPNPEHLLSKVQQQQEMARKYCQ